MSRIRTASYVSVLKSVYAHKTMLPAVTFNITLWAQNMFHYLQHAMCDAQFINYHKLT